ncbi:fibulin-5 [Cimex lectularius]|uniref:EGF-like domain-containing protein n=1 Tax=Cimex lectularius TaxID=79782 RepID=A0A8I6R8H1_CIMLE|nr:fibulin-5 [Cimex lectularius]
MTAHTTTTLVAILFCLAIGGVTGGELETTLFRCCNFGLGAVNKNCSYTKPIQHISLQNQKICASTLELCCAREKREKNCEDGKTAAQNGEHCSYLDNNDKQFCCEACTLGSLIGATGNNCNLGRIDFGTLLGTTYLSCCRNASTQQQYQSNPDNMCEVLPGELCAHNCHSIPGSYKCSCRPGYVLLPDGKSCEENIADKCQSSANRCSQRCSSSGSNIVCSCYPGYYLSQDKVTCKRMPDSSQRCKTGFAYNFTTRICSDIDECEEQHFCNIFTQDCVNTEGNYRCIPKRNCRVGFRFNKQRNACIDIDECTEQKPCDSTQICHNTEGSYECSCLPGYSRDHLTLGCIDINECQTNAANCRIGERCDNTLGSYICVRNANCGTGYTLNAVTGKCEDNDECASNTHDCDLAGPDRVCLNTQGSFRCVRRAVQGNGYCPNNNCNPRPCPQGYKLVNRQCVDINECAERVHLCPRNEICVNVQGSYRCNKVVNCEPGFKLAPDRRNCIDINECVEHAGLCSHSCINLYGNFTCGCNPGYKLDVDNRSCIDIDECENSFQVCNGLCVNEPGSYSCQCPRGYRLSYNKHSCEDIDECREPDACSHSNDTCLNMRGGHRCFQVTCPPGYEKDLSHENRCRRQNNKCHNNDLACTEQPLSYTSHYITITSNITVEPSGLDIFNVKAPSYSLTTIDFKLELSQVIASPQIRKATMENFALRMSGHNKATLTIIKSIEGPQDIEIRLYMNFFTNRIYGGTTVSIVEIYVSQFPF